jgi:hypothetical protein
MAKFWGMLDMKVLEKRPGLAADRAMDKLVSQYSMAVEHDVKIEKGESGYVGRVMLKDYRDIDIGLHCGGGLFYELEVEDIGKMADFITRKNQTVGVFGFDREELKTFVVEKMPDGIDRFVSIGRALEFSPVWDGVDLLREFTREIEINV